MIEIWADTEDRVHGRVRRSAFYICGQKFRIEDEDSFGELIGVELRACEKCQRLMTGNLNYGDLVEDSLDEIVPIA